MTKLNGQSASTDQQSWRLLFSHASLLRGQEWNLAAVVVIMLIATVISLAVPVYAGRFVDRLSAAGSLAGASGALYALAGLLVAQLVGSFFYQYLSMRLGLRTVTKLRRRVYSHLLGLPSLYFTHRKAGDLSAHVTSDVGSIQYMLTNGIVAVSRAILTLIGAIILMLRLNVQLTMVVLLLVPATVLLVSFFGSRMRKLSRRMYDELGQLSSYVQEIAGNIRAVKVFGSQDFERDRFDKRLQDYEVAGFRRAILSSILDSGAQILLWICLVVVVVYGFYLSGQGRATYGELVAFMLLAFRVAAPLGSLTSLFTSAQGAMAASARLDDVFRIPPEQEYLGPGPAHASQTSQASGPGLTIDSVSFRYGDDPEATWTLSDVTTTIAPGEKVALVGPSGAGKTTLACLVLRLFDPQKGGLSLDGRPYTEHDLLALRARMAYVPQEPVLFDASIGDNIRFGLSAATKQDLEDAARHAQALDFITRQPDGFETLVGDRGVRLSGGERQRIALARAFLRNPELLVLDEPTSALDARSEEAVRTALAELMAGRTTLVVAHRLSLVRDLDRILVLDRGRLVEQGPHQQLLAAGGMYAHLYELQQGQGSDKDA